jgi:hypothetical protein
VVRAVAREDPSMATAAASGPPSRVARVRQQRWRGRAALTQLVAQSGPLSLCARMFARVFRGISGSRVAAFSRMMRMAAIAWLLTVGAGFASLTYYANTPGPVADARVEWPADAGIVRARGGATLVMFVHPQCACSAASVGELARLMAREQGAVDARVLVYAPSAESDRWSHGDLWRAAERIPGVRVSADRNGAQAGRFGAQVSGQTFLYDAAGRLLFSGGITPARGHAGDNAGRRALQRLIEGTTAADAVAPVFGCFLRGERS